MASAMFWGLATSVSPITSTTWIAIATVWQFSQLA
jgi:hypothetical protein